jgi:hypothetical protein
MLPRSREILPRYRIDADRPRDRPRRTPFAPARTAPRGPGVG